MSHYVHHVPGRLRIRSKAFLCNPSKARLLEGQLRATDGVVDVRYNDRNGSLTIQYDPATPAGNIVMNTLTEAGCLPLARQGAARTGQDLAATFGKAVITALAQQTVVRSFSSLATILR